MVRASFSTHLLYGDPDSRLFFPKHENVDAVWSLIARAVACGPLKEAGVEVAKVSTTQEMDGEPVGIA